MMQTTPTRDISAYFAMCREREKIRLNKESGAPPPWTEDNILRTGSFCNVNRQDDRTTRWYTDNIRVPMEGRDELYIATVAFRWFNRISTGFILKDILTGPGWDHDKALVQFEHNNAPFVTGAYVIKSPNGMPKHIGVADCIQKMFVDVETFVPWLKTPGRTLQEVWERIREYPFQGNFMAYEIVCDLYHTHFLRDAPDIMTWASAGPGAARGISRVLYGDHTILKDGSARDQKIMLMEMRELLKHSQNPEHWPAEWKPWDMRTVEHTLCEFDKYERVRLGQGQMKRMYKPTLQ